MLDHHYSLHLYMDSGHQTIDAYDYYIFLIRKGHEEMFHCRKALAEFAKQIPC